MIWKIQLSPDENGTAEKEEGLEVFEKEVETSENGGHFFKEIGEREELTASIPEEDEPMEDNNNEEEPVDKPLLAHIAADKLHPTDPSSPQSDIDSVSTILSSMR